jgi:hypothetical protein
MNANGTGKTPVTDNGGSRRLVTTAYVSSLFQPPGEDSMIYVMNADGSDQCRFCTILLGDGLDPCLVRQDENCY